jgi:hypothetical protein
MIDTGERVDTMFEIRNPAAARSSRYSFSVLSISLGKSIIGFPSPKAFQSFFSRTNVMLGGGSRAQRLRSPVNAVNKAGSNPTFPHYGIWITIASLSAITIPFAILM